LTTYIFIVNNPVDNDVGIPVNNIDDQFTPGAGNIQQYRATVAGSIQEMG
jgi:hypothetical protein